MIPYYFSIDRPQLQYVHIRVEFDTPNDKLVFRLPSWRPGRYELGNFAKNIKGLKVFSLDNQRLEIHKLTKDSWQINTASTTKVRIEYDYFASELNAGSTFLSPDQLYVNPVNCCIYVDEYSDEPIQLQLNLPRNWQIACALSVKDNVLYAENFDQLVDSPFICSSELEHKEYSSGNCVFHIWFNGEVKPDWQRLLNDFKAFTDKQIEKFIEFPVNDYHFLIHALPYKAYHGVEHCASTVITLGPTYEIFKTLYKELLGISSHELYHTWNVKAIRPIEMFPYDFTKENYSRLGYICEGITTYMGDLFLIKSKVFSLNNYLDELNVQIQRHFDNPGRFNYSVAESSFDTWLDGYTPGAPGRKVSIYTEGCLLAFVTDTMIIRETKGKYGLDEVMKRLYFNYALKGKGVSENDYKKELFELTGVSFDLFFNDYVHGTKPFESILTDALNAIGFELQHKPSPSYAQGQLGFKYVVNNSSIIVSALYPGGPAEMAGMMLGDEIIAVNGFICSGEVEKWLRYFDNEDKKITVVRSGKLKELILPEVNRFFYLEYTVEPIKELTHHQKKSQDKWMS
jgi:predicted metalloprotease with PDZ domain